MSGVERITGGHSLHAAVKSDTACKDGLWPNQHKGPWRTVECGGKAGEDRDVVECAECGVQKNVACNFDEEYS